MLKDKIVFGIRSSQVREKLLTEDRLDLNKAITICKTSEQVSKQLEEFEGKNRADKVLIVRNKNVKQEQNKYFDCRRYGTNHKSRECPAFNKPCMKCNKNGHFAKMCRTKKNNANKQKNRVNAIEESSNSDDEVYISTIITGEKKNWTENVQVGSVKFTVKLDTGAECNVLPRHLMDKAKGRLKPSRTKNLISYTDDRMAVLGETDLQCKLKNEKQNITFKVVEERVMPILGLNTCEKLGLIARVKTLKEGTDDIFEGLGCYKDYEYDIDLIENPKLEIKALRKIPHAIRHEVKQELDRMVKLDVIKPETAPTLPDELQKTVHEVIETLKGSGFKLNKTKCIFEATRIKFLGHIVSANGLEADPDKVEAINAMKTPTNKTELQRLLGTITYLNKFIPNMSDLTNPLRDLLHKNTSFIWEVHHERSLNKIKQVLQSPPVLKLYDVNKPVTLTVDASSKNLGAALLQDGRPIAYAARALTKSEQNYPQIEKEALAIFFGCKKFHEYVYGKELTVESDHKPLETIFKKNIQSAPARLQRIMFILTPHLPKVIFKKGTEIPLADFLSRDCDASNLKYEQEENLKVAVILPMSLNAKEELINAAKEDSHLQLLLKTIQQGFPEKVNELPTELQHYFNFKEELTYLKIIFKGDKIVVPKSQIQKILKSIHQGHLGIQSCLRRARQFLYWKGQYDDIVKLVKSCSVCEQTQRDNCKNTVLVKKIPTLPWQIVSSDLFELKGSPNQRLFSRVTRSPIPTTENNLKPKLIKGVPTELQRLRETQVKYSNKHTTRPVNLEINDKVRHKVAHRQWEGARVVEKPEDLPRSVIIQTDKGQTLRRNFSHLHRTQADIISNKVVVPETKYTDVSVQAQSPAVPELPSAPVQSSPSTPNYMQEQTLNETGTAPRTSRFDRIIKPVNKLDL
ncbi:Retrovirus-related Pol polyprotein from transposon 17.6 [Eumeta japonica]|uniref:RNA-directed DNA polymerase n=1 Tax=Eumeta variegata TaxID=151549 RepID=A0A4C1TST6_EUMVA|nr:Retrovirus-related Pol polyprotein from transposon 17.6 [Eumeta japonica]